MTFSNLFYILGLTLDYNNLENVNLFIKISKINDYKNYPKNFFGLISITESRPKIILYLLITFKYICFVIKYFKYYV